jgi:superfamily I DNA and/or RNA helicase
MNFEQRELIEELLYARLKGDSLSNSWIESREETPEPFFIRNLENVQGDERDVIFISVTYGPDSQGNYYQRYAGVNTQSGHRRLNVLITRAKKRCIVFSSRTQGIHAVCKERHLCSACHFSRRRIFE